MAVVRFKPVDFSNGFDGAKEACLLTMIHLRNRGIFSIAEERREDWQLTIVDDLENPIEKVMKQEGVKDHAHSHASGQ